MKKWKRWSCLLLAGIVTLGLFSGCGGSSGDSDEALSFTWWICDTDGKGTFYEKYEDNPVVQWLNNQYWDTTAGGLGTSDGGKRISLGFQVPIAGAERDNFSTMVSTGDYPEIIEMNYASTPVEMYQDGHIIEITEYVEQYCPNYVALMEKYPYMKDFTTVTDEAGNVHYYALYNIADAVKVPWLGHMYRRDWIVKYAEPTEYVWDWDSAEVKGSGHPAVTPLADALSSGNLEGWKKNEVTHFEKSEGDDPNNDWVDNVIFPSGGTDPYTISDWEWMFEAFTRALEAEGFGNDSNAYATSILYLGYMETGELISSFGGGGPNWYIDNNRQVQFGGAGDNFKTYLECLHNWNEQGWLDSKFESRASDTFYQINANGYSRGMVGLWLGGIGDTGASIRTTCTTADGQKDAMVFPCALPINDVYGSDVQKFNTPDMLYQDPRISSPVGFTTKCEGKDLATLFTMLNYLYSEEGSKVVSMGLNEEQYASMDFDPDLYKDNGLTSAYTEEVVDGVKYYHLTVNASRELANAMKGNRLAASLYLQGNPEEGYILDRGYDKVNEHAITLWSKYEASSAIRDYIGLLTPEETAAYNKTHNYLLDHMGQAIPNLIKTGLDGWDDYCTKLAKYGPDKVTQIFQGHIK